MDEKAVMDRLGRGYGSMAYGASLAFAGRAVAVPDWGTPVLLRSIPGGEGRVDAAGPYPLCALSPGAGIEAGLEALREAGAVSAVLVADPLRGPPPERLERGFALCRPFKTHHVIDRERGGFAPSRHHAERIRRGRRRSEARRVSLRETRWREAWQGLYAGLVARRRLTGTAAFPDSAFEALARLPDDELAVFAAETSANEVTAMQIWVRDGDRAYSHLTATSAAGYRDGATYVVNAAAIEHLAECRLLDLGGGAGLRDDPADPLAQFKRGFANAERTAWLCGAVLDPAAYARLAPGAAAGGFFPAYRKPVESQGIATTSTMPASSAAM